MAYYLGDPPSRSTRHLKGTLIVEDGRIEVVGRQPLVLQASEVRSLTFRREFGLFFITLEADPLLHLTPILFTFGGLVQIMLESRNTAVYTALHRLFGGPGRCAKCNFDLRASALPCPECGGDRVRPAS